MQNLTQFTTAQLSQLGSKAKRSISPPKRSGSPPPQKASGRLHVLIVEAKNLHPKEKNDVVSVVSDVVGMSTMTSDDPFCKVTVGRKTFKTSFKLNTLSPKWGDKFLFDAVEQTAVLKIVIRDNLTIGKGHFFGEVSIPIASLKKYQEIDEWYPLCKRPSITTDVSGSLHVKIYYQPDKDLNPPTGSITIPASTDKGAMSDDGLSTSPTQTDLKDSDSDSDDDDDEDEFTDKSTSPTPAMSSSPIMNHIQLSSSLPEVHPHSDEEEIATNTPPPASSNSVSAYVTLRPKSNSFTSRNSLNDDLSPKSRRMSMRPHGPSPLVTQGFIVESDPVGKELQMRTVDPKLQERQDAFSKRFNLPPDESLLKVYSAALHKQLLLHGRLFVSTNYVCFHSNIFGIKTTEVIPISEITEIKKNFFNLSLGIQINTATKQFNFASFFSRDKAFEVLNTVWKNSKQEEQKTTLKECASTTEEEEDDHWEDSFLSLEDSDGGFLTSENLTKMVTEEFPISVIYFFKLFFSDMNFTRIYHEARNDKDISIKDWASHSQYGTTRQLQYKAPLKYPIGPSSAQCEETQRYHLSKTHLTVETILVMYDIPYGDYFRVESKWEVAAGVTPNTCILNVSTGVHFMKKTWWKSKIENGSMKESEDGFNLWVQLARKEIAKQPQPTRPSIDKSADERPPAGSATNLTSSSPTTTPNFQVENKKTLVEAIAEKVRKISLTMYGLSACILLLLFILWWTNQIESDIKTVAVLTLFYLFGYRIYVLEQRLALLDLRMQKSQ